MPFNIGLTGLNAATKDLEVTGHNVSNASTAGFKGSRAEFADVFALSYTGVSNLATGSGVQLSDVSQQFNQGDLEFTQNNLDLALNGRGFFTVERDGIREYTRAGQFIADKEGFIINSAGQRLQGYPPEGGADVGDIRLTTGEAEPQATTGIEALLNLKSTAEPTGGEFGELTLPDGFDAGDPDTWGDFQSFLEGLGLDVSGTDITNTTGNEITLSRADGTVWQTFADGNTAPLSDPGGLDSNERISLSTGPDSIDLDPDDPETYNESTSLTVYDSLGQEHTASLFFQRNPPPADKTWNVEAFIAGESVGDGTLVFNADGTLDADASDPLQIDYAPGNGANRLDLAVDFTETTQYGDRFSVSRLNQDGFAPGQLIDVSVESDGTVFARFTNGVNRSLGQVAVASFDNPQGLQPVGGTNWVETFGSGEPLMGRAGDSGFGLIQGGAYENSNVDIAEQLVNLITAQRNYQANAQVISTADTITQTIINIR
ncbi:flagellar hook protein FlgE [Ectothiorhodospira marina]|uniref:Flagellar hook protein FlgE n=1 Tax=Ectothiorhodospira marina TaxID=1396821 RepID=A0A1H7FFZ3_9GAMM|nr:flagellar hook protein FlgE [Ectothiorhodospira marina]SEK25083.1 flagellar hook protein FlgE [Ectothiorhodospira marina]